MGRCEDERRSHLPELLAERYPPAGNGEAETLLDQLQQERFGSRRSRDRSPRR